MVSWVIDSRGPLQTERLCIYRMTWRHSIGLVYGHDTISMLYGMMSYFAKLTGEDLSRYLSKIESVDTFKKYLMLAANRRSDC